MMSERQPSGACHDLLPEVADKYFQASRVGERFQYDTARAMCMGHCAFQLECLTQAIQKPQPAGIRGGESPEAIIALNHEMKRERTPAAVLAARAISHQLKPLRGAYGQPRLRAGQFDTPPLAFPELGGEQ